MRGIRYTEEFKMAAIRKVTEYGYKRSEVAKRLKVELKRVTQERNILKEAAAFFAGGSKTVSC